MPNLHETIPAEDSAILNDEKNFNKKIVSVPKPEQNIGIDTKGQFLDNIVSASESNQLDISAFNNFLNVSRRRDEVYSLLDNMCEDSTVAAVLETYAEDATEYNDDGRIVWAESDDANISKYINILIDILKIDKNAYSWVNAMCKYGDLYVELFRKSEHDAVDDLFEPKTEEKDKTLNEQLIVNAYKKEDKYVEYVEAVKNPAEMFELTKFGKTRGYIRTDIVSVQPQSNDILGAKIFNYQFKQSDVNIYPANKFVHMTLDDDSNRTEEEVQLFINTDANDPTKEKSYTYKVKRGQSLFYNLFRIWRELMLLENSLLLNRITKSSILRIIGVEVGDMPKEMVGSHLQGIKSMMEQKAALNTGKSINEYTNPGPMENNIYVPTHGGIGAITTSQVGGDVNVGQLSDIDYFQNKFFGSLRIPKQYFGLTEDGAGFNGGQSLSIISSRYAKMTKRIQNAFIQGLTDLVNLFLLDRGLDNYVNNFTLHMLPPTTQEEIDRRNNLTSKVGIINDIMNLLSDVSDVSIKLRILKIMLATVVTDSEIISCLEEEIDKLEKEEKGESEPQPSESEESFGGSSGGISDSTPLNLDDSLGLGSEPGEEEITSEEEITTEEPAEETILPTPADLGIDMTDNTVEQ